MTLDRSSIKTVAANGLDFSYYELGTGPLALCFHGFPDSPESWADLLPDLADAGYRAVAPFMRGYPPTSIPVDGDYFGDVLGDDVLALISALGGESAVLIGHDWGASAVYAATTRAPERVRKLVAMAVPQPSALLPTPGLLWGVRHFLEFQRRQHTVDRIRTDDLAFLRSIYARWSPNWTPADHEFDGVRACWQTPGAIEATLGYYWSFVGSGFGARSRAFSKSLARKVDVPTLVVVGEADHAIPATAFPRAARWFTGPYQLLTVPRAGHFVHREEPAHVNAAVLEFLGRAA